MDYLDLTIVTHILIYYIIHLFDNMKNIKTI